MKRFLPFEQGIVLDIVEHFNYPKVPFQGKYADTNTFQSMLI